MTEFKNTERELYFFRLRISVVGGFVLLCFGLLLARFVWLQIYKRSDYAAQAEDNRIMVVPLVPNRGLIVDRNGVVLARNYSAYTLEITPSKIPRDQTLDQVIDALSEVVDIQSKDRKRFRKLLEDSKSVESTPIRTRLSDEEVARFTAQRYRFPGVEINARLFRQYPLGSVASHVIGYIGRVNQKDAEKIEAMEDAANYNGTEYIGKEGLEKSYEKELHGTTGNEEVEKSAGGRAVRTLSRSSANPGNNLVLSIDIELQKIVEEAFGDRRGAFVAIDPATGEILAYVSKPTYDPNLFVEGIDQQSWDELNNSPDKPLINRPISGTYAPGSTYKPYMALAALQYGVRTPAQSIVDPGHFVFGNHTFNDDKPQGHGVVDMYRSIAFSCDTYYFMLANDLGVDRIHDFMKQFGFGELSGIDLNNERAGLLPSTVWKRTAFKSPERKRWVPGDTISLGIGQGYNSFTPMEIAKAIATLSNDGVMMKPHLVKAVESGVTLERKPIAPVVENRIDIKPENLEVIRHAMIGVTTEPGATAYNVFKGAEYTSGGKTGTAQVVGLKKNEKYNRNGAERLRDNALYTAFAPADHPRIAIAVIVENGNFGAESAAPIARKALDYFLLGKRPDGKEAAPPPKTDNSEEAPDPETQPEDVQPTMPPAAPDAEGKRP
ncbi:MAG: penicillin-binding protein 2 [Burkholderiaceae bacterium]|nr:penicillin-binding protein 2 [Burkholderiaceae bacterium]